MVLTRSRAGLLLLCLIASSALASAEDAEDVDTSDEDYEEQYEKAFLIVRKKVLETDVIVGKNMTVSISVYNAGNSAALDVSVEDPSWPEEHFRQGQEQARESFPRIAAGATVELKYTVWPLSEAGKSQFYGQPAVVRYVPESDSKEVQVAYSTTPIFFVFSKYQTYVRSLLTLGSYVTGGALTHPTHWSRFSYVLGSLAAIAGGTWLFAAFRDANKRRRYQRAYAEVQSYE